MSTVTQDLMQLMDGFKEFRAKNDARAAGMQRQLDCLDSKAQRPDFGGGGTKDLATELFENPEFTAFAKTGRGQVAVSVPDFQKKAAVLASTVGFSAPGVVPSEHINGIIPMGMETFHVRDLLRKIPSTAGMVDYIRATGYTKASPQTEAEEKLQATITFANVSEKMKTIAHWIPASNQVLQDVTGLQEAINVHLLAGLRDQEDYELLFGDGTGENLNGLVTLADDFDISLLTACDGYEYLDLVNAAMGQVASNKYVADGVVVSPVDWFKMTRTKGADGRYILGDPASMTQTRVWGRPVAVTSAMPTGSFLVGAFGRGAAMHVRMDGIVEVSDSHDDYFIRNKVAIRCEERILLATYTPAAFCWGSLVQSPA